MEGADIREKDCSKALIADGSRSHPTNPRTRIGDRADPIPAGTVTRPTRSYILMSRAKSFPFAFNLEPYFTDGLPITCNICIT